MVSKFYKLLIFSLLCSNSLIYSIRHNPAGLYDDPFSSDSDTPAQLSDAVIDDIFSDVPSAHAFLAAMTNRAASPTSDSDASHSTSGSTSGSSHTSSSDSDADDEFVESPLQILLSTQMRLAANRHLRSQDTSASALNFSFACSSESLQPISPRHAACMLIGRLPSGTHPGVAVIRVSPIALTWLAMRHDQASMTTHRRDDHGLLSAHMFDALRSMTTQGDNLGLMATHMHHNELASLTSSLPSQHCTVVLKDYGHTTPWTPCNAQPVQYTKYTKPRFQTKHTPCKQQPIKSSSQRRKQLTNVRHRIKDNK